MATIIVPRRITAAEYEQLDEILGFRDELIEGERVLSPSPIFKHVLVLEQLEVTLKQQLLDLSDKPLHVVREAGWKFHNPASGADSVLVPDLMVIREEDARLADEGDGWFEGTPLLVIEVVSPSERKSQRLRKIGLYLDMAVPAVVEVDYKKRIVLVHTPDKDLATEYRKGDRLTTPFQADVDEIFSVIAEDRPK